MREIKFRQYVYGRYHYWGFSTGVWNNSVFAGPANPYDPSEQFTGLRDKNGVEIYEGDLLTSDVVYLNKDRDIVEKPCTVVWCEDLAGWALEKDRVIHELSYFLTGWTSAVFVKIGNIHETPELLRDLREKDKED